MQSIDDLPCVQYHPAIQDQARLIAGWITENWEAGYCCWDGPIYKAIHDLLTKKGFLVGKRFYSNLETDVYEWDLKRREWTIRWNGFYKTEMPPGQTFSSRQILTQHDWLKTFKDIQIQNDQ